jgi:hypothetical protein
MLLTWINALPKTLRIMLLLSKRTTWEEVPMAVTFVRSALMVPGKFPQAHEYLEKRMKWLKEKFGVEASLMALLGGQVGRIATVTEQDDVAEIEKIRREIVGGALPKELATGAEGLFVPGETRDRIWLKIR